MGGVLMKYINPAEYGFENDKKKGKSKKSTKKKTSKKKKPISPSKKAPSAIMGEVDVNPNIKWMDLSDDPSEKVEGLILKDDVTKSEERRLIRAMIDDRKMRSYSEDTLDDTSWKFFTENDQRTESSLSTYMSNGEREILYHSKILDWFTEDQLKLLYVTIARNDIVDNNEKCDMIKRIIGPSFIEIGAGTNRIAFRKSGYVISIALDSRGSTDNNVEFCRAPDLPEYMTWTYESNSMIVIEKYINGYKRKEFHEDIDRINSMMEYVTADFIVDDLCTDSDKNYTNFGYVWENYYDEKTGKYVDARKPVIRDGGYVYRKPKGWKATCPYCGSEMHINKGFSYWICYGNSSHICTTAEIRQMMEKSAEKEEIDNIYDRTGVRLCTAENFSDFLYSDMADGEAKSNIDTAVKKSFNALDAYLNGGD